MLYAGRLGIHKAKLARIDAPRDSSLPACPEASLHGAGLSICKKDGN